MSAMCMMHVCQGARPSVNVYDACVSRCETKCQCVVCMCVSGSDTLCAVCTCECDSHRHTLSLRVVCLSVSQSVTSFSVQGLAQGLGIRYRAQRRSMSVELLSMHLFQKHR